MKTEHIELLQRLEGYAPDEPTAFPFSERLARENGWSPSYARRVIHEYKRFAFLAVAAGHPVSPSDEVDQAWHLHMLYTRAYWTDFCAEVLRTPLHHQPTKGGGEERGKFHDWYHRTLESYRRFFNMEPPSDIWPAAERRFGEDIHFVRVNEVRNWIIPKPTSLSRLRNLGALALNRPGQRWPWGASVAALAICGAGCGAVLSNSASLNDYGGQNFLAAFLLLWAGIHGAAALLRVWLRNSPAGDRDDFGELDSYAVAFLSGGGSRTFDAAIAKLVHGGVLTLDPAEARLRRSGPLPDDSGPFERAIHEMVPADAGASIAEVRKQVQPLLTVFADGLTGRGLWLSTAQSVDAVTFPLLLALLVPAIGWIQVLNNGLQGNSMNSLSGWCMASLFVALAGFARRPRRSRQGDRVLAELKERHTSLHSIQPQGEVGAASGAVPLAVGLFGLGVLGEIAAADLAQALHSKRDSNGCGGGCGGDGDSGGCGGGCGAGCGGGCGGCGG